MSFLRLATKSIAIPRAAWTIQRQSGYIQRALFSSDSGLSREVIQKRILDVLKGYEKINKTKLTPEASFANDLGLDSLDTVEVVMAVEEEFDVEIPDAEADQILTVSQAIDYIAKTPEGELFVYGTDQPIN
ncbi:acyl carrier protein-like protein [Cyathus striatus]|nr:acyl carrier protein-like protein [Cyathus striatus]